MFDNVDDDSDDLDDIVCCGSDVLCLEHVRFVAHPAAGGTVAVGGRRRSEDGSSVGPNDGATCIGLVARRDIYNTTLSTYRPPRTTVSVGALHPGLQC